MVPKQSIWSDLPLSTGIATFVCYAGVFNDVIGIEDLAAGLGVSGQDEFYAALNEMHRRGRLVLKDGFAGLPDLEANVAIKISKIATAKQLISSRMNCLNKLGRNPLIKFVGISGSLAARNPTRDRDNRVDLDIFLIIRNQCLWPYSILRGIRDLFPPSKREPRLCMNYFMDESNVLIANRNFYTATEIRNLIPVSGLDAYRKFIQVNRWVDYYYPGTSGASAAIAAAPSVNLINKIFYVLFVVLRSIKWLSLDPLRKFSFTADAHSDIGLNRCCAPYGGYQTLVQKKFRRLAEAWFPECLDGALIEKLFPDDLSVEIRSGEIEAVNHLMLDYSKYG